MKESKLRAMSLDFAVEIIKLVKFLKLQKESVVANQIGRSGTSIGANIHEAQFAHGKADFIAKLQIALKEAGETSYWLQLLQRTGFLSMDEFQKFEAWCSQLRAMLIASINTARGTEKQDQ